MCKIMIKKCESFLYSDLFIKMFKKKKPEYKKIETCTDLTSENNRS